MMIPIMIEDNCETYFRAIMNIGGRSSEPNARRNIRMAIDRVEVRNFIS